MGAPLATWGKWAVWQSSAASGVTGHTSSRAAWHTDTAPLRAAGATAAITAPTSLRNAMSTSWTHDATWPLAKSEGQTVSASSAVSGGRSDSFSGHDYGFSALATVLRAAPLGDRYTA